MSAARRKKKAEPAARVATDRRDWTRRLILGTLAWIVPVAIVWLLLAPSYNRFLEVAGQNLARLTESPDVTRLDPKDDHYVLVSRLDFPAQRETVGQLRLTDLHFPVVLMAALFLAVPGAPWKEKLSNLGFALVLLALFHVALLLFEIRFLYTTQLGDWSLENYGAFARNFWGLGKHILDLPVKLALPLLMWAGFYVGELMPKR